MTDEAKALAAKLRAYECLHGNKHVICETAADLIEAQAREIERLREAGTALYMAGRWSCDAQVDEAALWIAMRDALGLPAGTETARAALGASHDQ